MGEVGEGGGEGGPLLGGQRGGVVLETGEAGGFDAVDDLAAVGCDPDALHAAVGGVLAAFEPAAAQQPVHRAAGAWQREAEAACELLDGHLVGALVERVQRLNLRDGDLEVGDQPVELLAGAAGQVVPELEELGGELLARYLRISSNCFLVRNYCTCAVVVRFGYPNRTARAPRAPRRPTSSTSPSLCAARAAPSAA